MPEANRREFVTLLAASVFDYGRLMASDDIATTTALRSLRRDLMIPMLGGYNARLVSINGDAMLFEFATAADAVAYAVALQRAVMSRNAPIKEHQRIWLHIGINLGDVVLDGNDIYGNGVKVATELAAISDPGGVCISASVESSIRDTLAFPFQRRGGVDASGPEQPHPFFDLSANFIAQLPERGTPPAQGLPRVRMQIREGTQLNDAYEIDRLIGSGGMGEIFRGHEIHTGDPVAIKLIRLDMESNDAALALFQKEASVLKHIYHEAIVRYYVFSLDQTVGRHYLAMEFVNGPSLSELLRKGPLSYEDVNALRVRVAEGLQVAHERGVVHRDVSPDNIILPNGNAASAKIIDFGIARSADAGGATVIGGGFAGKYDYVSPEQLGLFGSEVTGKSDIYSLGLVLAAALTGKPIDMSGSQVDTIEKRRVVPNLDDIDERLRPLIALMLQPDPDARPASMAAVASWSQETIIAPKRKKAEPVRDATSKSASPIPTSKLQRRILIGAGVVALLFFAALTALRLDKPSETAATNEHSSDAVLIPHQSSHNEPAVTQPDNGPDDGSKTDLSSNGSGTTTPTTTSEPVVPNKPTHDAALEPVVGTPAEIGSYVRGYDGGSCFYAQLTSAKANSGGVEAFAQTGAAFEIFDKAFSKAIGFEPDIVGNRVWSHQCPAIEFLKRVQKAGTAFEPMVFLKSARLKSGQSLAGEINGTDGQVVTLLEVHEDGLVENVSSALKPGTSGQEFNLVLKNTENGGPYPRLIMIVATPQKIPGMPTTAMPADEFFKDMLGAIDAGNAKFGVSAKLVLLSQ
jgi:serine/threonine-protein kinase